MVLSFQISNQPRDQQQKKQKGEWLAGSFKPENFIPGLVIGFIFGLLLDLTKPARNHSPKKNFSSTKLQQQLSVSSNGDQDLKMVLVVRQDLKMKSGKIASQCARKIQNYCYFLGSVLHLKFIKDLFPPFTNFIFALSILFGLVVYTFTFTFFVDAATGMYAELMQSHRSLLRQWEQCGQPKIVVTCRNQQEMNKIKEAAESIALPTFVVADAGRTQVVAGSKTVLAVGPGPKSYVDSVTGKLALL